MTTARGPVQVCEIRHILKAFHAPDKGSFGACVKCAHRAPPNADGADGADEADEQRCAHPFAHGLLTAQARARTGVCGVDASLHLYQPLTPAQPALDLY